MSSKEGVKTEDDIGLVLYDEKGNIKDTRSKSVNRPRSNKKKTRTDKFKELMKKVAENW